MKRLNLLYLGLILLLTTSCGNSFLSKSSTKNTVDISFTIPLEALKSSSPAARAAGGESNKLTVELYVDEDKKYETVITNLDKKQETVTFPNITIGSTVKATATFIYNEQKYYGESETATVTEKGASLSLILTKVKQEIKQNTSNSLLAEPTEEGVKLTLDNLTQGDFIRIYILGENGTWYERFYFQVTQSKYILLDKYVNANETITYEFAVYHNGNAVTSDPITVTTKGGSGRPSISAEKTSDGIYLTIQTAIPTEQVEIFRLETNGINTETISLYKENASDILNKSFTDYFVNSGKEYSYSASTFIHNYDAAGVLYNPRSNIVSITADSGLGDITVTNVPEATYDETSMVLNFSTPPEARISGTINGVSLGVEFIYNILPGSENISILYTFGENSSDISWMAQDPRLMGKTLQLRSDTSEGQLYCGHAFDVENKISYSIYHYDNIDLSKMPKTIVIHGEPAINTTPNEAVDIIPNITGPANLTISGEASETLLTEIAQALKALQTGPTISLDISGITGIDKIPNYAFQYCNSLKYIKLPYDVTEIGEYAFIGCYLTGIEFPDGLTSIDQCAFCDCSYLESLNLPASLTFIGENAFGRTRELATITVDQTNKTFSVVNNVLFGDTGTTLIRYPSALTDTSYAVPYGVTKIAGDAFSDCNFLETISLPDGVVSLGKTSFAWCQNLQSINIPGTVIDIDWSPFKYCYKLEEIAVNSENTKYKDDGGILFEIDEGGNEIALIQYPPSKQGQSYTVPNSVITIRASAFNYAKNLTSVTLGTGVETIEFWAFDGAEFITDLTIPANVKKLEGGALSGANFETLTFEQQEGWKWIYRDNQGQDQDVSLDDLQNPNNFNGYNSLFNQYTLYHVETNP